MVQLLSKLYGVPLNARFRVPPQKRSRSQGGPAPVEDTVGEDLIDDATFAALYGGGAPQASDAPAQTATTMESAALISAAEEAVEALILEAVEDDTPTELLTLATAVDEAALGEATLDADKAAALDATLDAARGLGEEWSPLADRAAAQALLAAAESRDELGRVLVRVALAKGPRAVLFTLSQGIWLGWTGYGPGIDPDAVRSLMVPVAANTCFGIVGSTGGYFIGPPTQHQVYDRFFAALGGARPQTVGLFPVHYHGRVVFGIYTDGGDGAGIDHDIANILIVAQQVPRTLDRQLQARRAA